MVASTTETVPARAAITTLDVVSLLGALLVPPVGAVFGLLARRAAKEKELAPHPLSTAAIVVGTFVTGVAVLYLLAPALSTVAFLG